MDLQGGDGPLLNARVYGWRRGVSRRKHQFIPSKGVNVS